MFPRFVLFLLPLIITAIVIPLLGLEVVNPDGAEYVAYLLIALISIGALVSGFFVARVVYRAIKEPQWWKILGSILVFISVTVGYLGVGLFGGCLLLITAAK